MGVWGVCSPVIAGTLKRRTETAEAEICLHVFVCGSRWVNLHPSVSLTAARNSDIMALMVS